MAKKPPARRKEGEPALPPHPRAGYYQDTTNKLYWVPNKPTFSLYRLDYNFEVINPDSPVLSEKEEAEFEKQLRHQTFTRIKH